MEDIKIKESNLIKDGEIFSNSVDIYIKNIRKFIMYVMSSEGMYKNKTYSFRLEIAFKIYLDTLKIVSKNYYDGFCNSSLQVELNTIADIIERELIIVIDPKCEFTIEDLDNHIKELNIRFPDYVNYIKDILDGKCGLIQSKWSKR